jgi:hypothetical protein
VDVDVKQACKGLRQQIGIFTASVDDLIRDCKTAQLAVAPNVPPSDRGEMIANATLAKRHLEDARMRLGKVVQAFDGGVSVYKE